MSGILINMYSENPDIQDEIKRGDWTHGLCGCFDNIGMCVVAYFVPCVTWAQTAQELGKDCCLYSLFWFIPFVNCYLVAKQRGEIRDLRGIDGSMCGDCVTCGCCSLCALVQEQQEVMHIKEDILLALTRLQGGTVVVGNHIATADGVIIQTSQTAIPVTTTAPAYQATPANPGYPVQPSPFPSYPGYPPPDAPYYTEKQQPTGHQNQSLDRE